MKKKLINLFLTLFAAFAVIGFVGCTDEEPSPQGLAHVHNYTLMKYDETNHWEECVCGEKGASTPHDWQTQHTCGTCDVLTGTTGLSYTRSNDGKYYIVSGIGKATETNIVIGNVYNGLLVKKVGELK